MASRVAVIGLIVVGLAIAIGAAQNAPAGQAAPAGQPPPAAQAPLAPCGPNITDSKNVAKDSRCFELRTYNVQPGSSLDLLHSRFRDHTMALFKKHGITVVGFWHPTNKPDALIYLLVYKDRQARDDAWKAFNADPEWVKVRQEMNVSLKVDDVFMSATDYSPMK
jgi:hypothetical protein